MPEIRKKTYCVSSFINDIELPHLSLERNKHQTKSTIDDFEGLFIDYGFRETSYPYTQQNLYSDEHEQEINVVILENELLYAEFLPDFGGRLWKLYDKTNKKDILYTNDVIRFRNLSIRNAWFSGGVEWNCGIVGHSPFTCSRMYCAFVRGKNGEDVLRFYEYERVRGICYQMDFWLEENKLLSCVRIENNNNEVVPMYWWSNMATPEYKNGRVVVPASSAYNNSDGMGIKKSLIPIDNKIDVSYPENISDTIDYFYDIADDEDKFIANIGSDGKGLLQFSSHRLKGRKLFSWGHRKGSYHWQSLLTDKAGPYVEIQAGLGKTQYECIPMPPKTKWSFMECYVLADIPADKLNAPYDKLIESVKSQMNKLGGCRELDDRLKKVIEDISLQKGEIIFKGSGFGFLNEKLGGKIPPQLEFFENDDISDWLILLDGGKPKNELSFAYGNEMKQLLLRNECICDWNIQYQLALLAYDKRQFEKAKSYCENSFIYDNNIKNNHLYAYILYQLGDERSIYFAEKCLKLKNDSYRLVESVFSLMLKQNAFSKLISCFDGLDESLTSNPRLLMYLSMAHLKNGNALQAEKTLLADGGLILRDFREGDKFLDNLYKGIRKTLYNEKSNEIIVPEQFDFIVANLGEAHE